MDMMRRSFLQFLAADDIFRVAVTCKELRTIIDPEECDKFGVQFKKSNHLKRVAMVQWLGSDDGILEEADVIFGIDIRKVSDMSYLNGQVYKDQLFSILAQPPTMDRYSSSDLRNIWLNEEFGNVLTSLQSKNCPLAGSLRRMRLDYDH